MPNDGQELPIANDRFRVGCARLLTILNLHATPEPFIQRSPRTFAYFMASGTQYTLKGISYLDLYGNEPSAIEQVYAIFANVLELDEAGLVMNAHYAQKRATDYLRAYCDPSFKVEPPYEDWEVALHAPPPRLDPI